MARSKRKAKGKKKAKVKQRAKPREARKRKPVPAPRQAESYTHPQSDNPGTADLGMPVRTFKATSEPNVPWGPDKPHPLSTRRTELVWEGKYDEFGNRREVDIAGSAMPMQRIETIDQPRSEADAAGQLELFEKKTKRLDDFRNMLIWGDNKLVMASLLKDFKGRIDLIYIDPPFDVGADFTMRLPIGDEKETIAKDQSVLEMVAYRDMWGRGTDSYLHIIYERLALMKELLSEKGTIYVHLDYRVVALVRLVLDSIFGPHAFRNEVIWYYSGGGASKEMFARKHDNILCYAKGPRPTFNVDEVRMEYKWTAGQKRADGSERDLEKGKLPDDVMGLDVIKLNKIMPWAEEHTGYETQKNEALVSTFIRASSNEGDLVADCFCGSGTTGATAERLGRRWIMCDLGRFAIHTSRKRLIDLQRKLHQEGKPYRSFDVYNLGRYERQWWQKERLKGADEEHRKVVLGFYRAEVIESGSSPLIHGRKGPALCHVDSIDSIFTRTELRAVAEAAKDAGAREVHCLAWEFEMDLRKEANALESELGLRIRLVYIPREIMEKNRTEPPPFFEMATLEAKAVFRGKGKDRTVDIKLTRFIPSLTEVPAKELKELQKRAAKTGFDFVDFWAVDFDYRDGEPFKHDWQAYRTRKKRDLPTVSNHGYKYAKKGKYKACVKVVDVFGCDTSITVEVRYE